MRVKLFFVLTLFFYFIFFSCSKKESASDKINVVVSIVPLAEFVEQVGGDHVDVEIMVPSGVSPHAYEPLPEQMVKISKADVYVKLGAPIEFELVWMPKILAMNKKMTVIDASENITLLQKQHLHGHNHGVRKATGKEATIDPHIWVSPVNAIQMVENIYQGLASIDPENKLFYEQNKAVCIDQLKELDTLFREKLADKKNRKFMVYHPAWGYLAEQYNLEQVAIEKEGKAPTAKGMKQLIDQARKHEIKIIFIDPLSDNSRADVIASEIGGTVISFSNLEKDYVANMKELAEILSEALD